MICPKFEILVGSAPPEIFSQQRPWQATLHYNQRVQPTRSDTQAAFKMEREKKMAANQFWVCSRLADFWLSICRSRSGD